MRKINHAGEMLIKGFEGIMDGDPTTVNIDPYLDPVGIATIGWGHAIIWHQDFLRGPEGLRMARQIYPNGLTMQECETLFQADLVPAENAVSSFVKVPLDDDQYSALVSFTFNVGGANLHTSTLLRLLNAGQYKPAAEQFDVWVIAKGRRIDGLVNRRNKEQALFLKSIVAKEAQEKAAAAAAAAAAEIDAARAAEREANAAKSQDSSGGVEQS